MLECRSDGGLLEGIGTMGYALTDGREVFCNASGPVDGDTKNMIMSRRSELFLFGGYA